MREYQYRGFTIKRDGEWYKVNNACYKTLKHAKDAINQHYWDKESAAFVESMDF